MKRILIRIYAAFNQLLFDPLLVLFKWRAIPVYLNNAISYKKRHHSPDTFKLKLRHLFFTTFDKYRSAGVAKGHYFFQDIWAAEKIYQAGLKEHVDVASRIDGFVAHLLSFCRVTYVDLREIDSTVPNFTFIAGSILDLPFQSNSLPSISCLHVIEHIGLGRYGDPVDPDGHRKAALELSRVLAPGGVLLLGTPVGKERLCFDAHRVFHPQTIIDLFPDLDLEEFSLIDDQGRKIIANADLQDAEQCRYGCGLFLFRKPSVSTVD